MSIKTAQLTEVIFLAKILIVDSDKSAVCDIQKLIPDSSKDTTEVLPNVSDALAHLKNNHADIIITDIFEPTPECTRIIDFCAAEQPDTRIVLTSRHKSFTYARMAVRCSNVVDFVTKPLDAVYTGNLIKSLADTADLPQEEETLQSYSREYELFSNIVHGYISNTDEIKNLFDCLNLAISLTDWPCTLVHFHMMDFAERARPEKLYDALRHVIPFETQDSYCALTNYSYGNFSYFIIHKNSDCLPREVSETLDKLKKTFEDKLSLLTEISSCKTWLSMSDMLSGIESTQFKNSGTADSTITNAIYFMKQSYQKDISLATVAEHVHMNPIYFSTYFKKHAGEKFMDVLTSIRIEQAAKLLATTRMTIKDIKLAVGYGHTGNFYKHFQDKYGMTPNEYKKQLTSKH